MIRCRRLDYEVDTETGSVGTAYLMRRGASDYFRWIPAAYLARLPETIYVLCELRRQNRLASRAEVMEFSRRWLTHALTESPVVYTQACRRLAEHYIAVCRRLGFAAVPVIGSLAGDPPLADKRYPDDGDDEQVFKIERRAPENAPAAKR